MGRKGHALTFITTKVTGYEKKFSNKEISEVDLSEHFESMSNKFDDKARDSKIFSPSLFRIWKIFEALAL